MSSFTSISKCYTGVLDRILQCCFTVLYHRVLVLFWPLQLPSHLMYFNNLGDTVYLREIEGYYQFMKQQYIVISADETLSSLTPSELLQQHWLCSLWCHTEDFKAVWPKEACIFSPLMVLALLQRCRSVLRVWHHRVVKGAAELFWPPNSGRCFSAECYFNMNQTGSFSWQGHSFAGSSCSMITYWSVANVMLHGSSPCSRAPQWW